MTSIKLQAIDNPLWAGPVLLTPVTLDALLVGTPNRSSKWAKVAMDYTRLAGGADPAPSAFEDGPAPEVGIHLQWTLPAALRHAAQLTDESPDVTFPPVPDRWMITRFYRANPNDKPDVVAWVLQSDFLGPRTEGTNTYPDPANPRRVLYIGKKYDLATWTGPAASPVSFLRAPGPGDLSWSAIYGNVRNVFAFYDPITLPAGDITYAVWGWYARPQDDPLYGPGTGFTTQQEWEAIMSSLQWGVGSAEDKDTRIAQAKQAFQSWLQANPITGGPPATPAQKELASQTLCHGMVFNVGWKGTAFAYPPPPIIAAAKPPQVAIGSNAAEAVSAWMGPKLNPSDPLEAERLLLAFQLNRIFDYVSDPVGFDIAAENARFAAVNGGLIWIVIRPQDAQEDGMGGVQQIPLTPEQTAKLTALNTTQLELGTLARTLSSQKWELFSAGWKLQRVDPFDPPLKNQIQAYIDELTPIISAGMDRIATLSAQRDRQKDELEALLGTEYVLTRSNLPQFDQAADPVVLLAGASGDTKLDQPRYPDETLFTRFTGQTLGGLVVDFTGIVSKPPVTLTAADILGPLTLPSGVSIPKETTDLWLEAMLLNLGNARWLAGIAFTKAGVVNPPPTEPQIVALTEQISKQQTLIWNPLPTADIDEETLAEAAGLVSLFPPQPVRVPLKTCVSKWAPPWTPLYLDWEISWAPTSTSMAGMLSQWQLGDLDYKWTANSVGSSTGKVQVRTILSSQYPKGLSDQLSEFLASTPGLDRLPAYQVEQLRTTAKTLEELDVMTQSLTGFAQVMLMRKVEPTTPPPGVDPSLIAGVMTWAPTPTVEETPGFFPVRAGHFQITRLRVVDAYGQILSGSIAGGPILPTRSESLTTRGTTNAGWMQTVPRVAQPVRLDLRLVDAKNDAIRSNSSDETSPLCGWLLPNHLNQSLMVFDAHGHSLGEVIRIERDEGPGIRWDAAPGSDAPLGGPPQISPVESAHLLAFVQGMLNSALVNRGSGSNVLDELLDLIDVSLWATDPLGPAPSGNLSVLIGRPIAVVRALITMELDGDPAYNQAWKQTGKRDTAGFPTAVKFPTRIGDFQLARNGALGYFQNDDYSKCYAMYGYEPRMGHVRRTVFNRGSRDFRGDLLRLASSAAASPSPVGATGTYVFTGHTFDLQPDSVTTVKLTALVDPRGYIPAVTGAIPVQGVALPNGPVDAALTAMAATFRMGPLLIDPDQIRMPLPAEVRGKWSWIERSGVTFWREEGPLQQMQPEGALPTGAMTIREGWLKLSGALRKDDEHA
ncbi:MAG TPA: hypothetical protein VF432_23140 [Thermoanaerobaculia bacterium]